MFIAKFEIFDSVQGRKRDHLVRHIHIDLFS